MAVNNNEQTDEIGAAFSDVTLALVPAVQEKVDSAVAVRAQEQKGEGKDERRK